jgi:plasmid stability protein
MPSVQIKGVPDAVHAVFRQRAARSHQSLQEYLLQLLMKEASVPTLEEIFDRIDATPGGASVSFELAAELMRDDRAGH